MKYHLLWVACTVGILQLSAVLCRSAHDKVTSTDNEKYPSTVAPSVAYTGQEFEHGTNSSNKLALDPGVASSDSQHYQFNWILVTLLICFGCFIISLLIAGCIAVYIWHKKVRPGTIVHRNDQGHGNQAQDLQFSPLPHHQPINAAAQQLTLTCQKCHQQSQFQPVQQPVGYQYQNTQPEKLPSRVCAVCHAPELQAGASVAPTRQPQAQEQPTVIEFENPVSGLKQPD